MEKKQFVTQYYPLAQTAGLKYNINPTVILAQAALESGWGSSFLARVKNNFFGITAGGSLNEYWQGERLPSKKYPSLVFRVYKTEQNSFYDFARLISLHYKTAASLSNDSAKYAKAIAYSPYISEKNGDNRPRYQKNITDFANYIDSVSGDLKKK